MRPALTPFRIQKFLAGLRYPATRQELLRRARELGAEDSVIKVLGALEERSYESPIALARAIGHPLDALGKLSSDLP